MCPICLGTAALIATATSNGGLTTFVASRLHLTQWTAAPSAVPPKPENRHEPVRRLTH